MITKTFCLVLVLFLCRQALAQSDYPLRTPREKPVPQSSYEERKQQEQQERLRIEREEYERKKAESQPYGNSYPKLDTRKPHIAQNAIMLNFGDAANGICFSYEHSWLTNDELLRWNGRAGWAAGERLLLDESNAGEYARNGVLVGAGLIYGKKWAWQADVNLIQYLTVNRVDATIAAGIRKQSSRGRLVTKTQIYYMPYGGYFNNWGYTLGFGVGF